MAENDNTADLTMDEKLDRLLAKMVTVETRLTKIEERAEERSSTTRPLLDQLIREMVTTRDTLVARADGTDARLDRIERQLKVLTQDVMTVRTEQQRLDDRMDTIERRPN